MKYAVRLARDPFVRFLALGAVLFGVDRALARSDERAGPSEIVVSDAFVAGLRVRHEAQTGERTSREDERALVRAFVREEALVREARAAHLESGDPIVRRRLVQKVEFLIAAQLEPTAPSDAELRAWIASHAPRIPSRTRFTHHLFARDVRGDRAAEDAREAIASLSRGESVRGDRFLRGDAIGPATDAQIDAAFGPRFAARIANLPMSEWSGPIDGALGQHIVRVIAREPSRVPSLEEAGAIAREALIEERRAEALDREIARIVARYRVTRIAEDAQ